jgi:hypothetical protein
MSQMSTGLSGDERQGICAFSIKGFCKAHSLSEAFFHNLQKQGLGPEVMKVGARTLITVEAARKWRAAREAAARKALAADAEA